MPPGLPHNGENTNKGYAILLSVRMWSCTPTENSDSISVHCFDNGDDRREEASIETL